MVAGEKSGNLNEMMQKIAEDLDKSKQLRGRILGAMIYPIILIVVLVIVIAAMLVFMVPAVEDLYSSFEGAELPGVTQILVNASNFVTSPAGIIGILAVVVFGVTSYRYYYSTPQGRRAIDRFLLKIPVFGSLQAKIQLAEFNRLISMLLKSGVPIVDALNIVANALSNTSFSELVENAALAVSKGNNLSIPLAKGEVFPLMLLKMLATGEETGKLDQVTEDMGKYFDQEVQEITGNLTKLMEPVIMVMVGGVVAFLAIAIYLPIYQLGQFAQ
jgi:type IV pilus assembly protein PilC